MKYTGLGMNQKLDSFEIIIKDKIMLKNDNLNLKFNLFDIENYKIGIASHYNVSDLIEYNIDELYWKLKKSKWIKIKSTYFTVILTFLLVAL